MSQLKVLLELKKRDLAKVAKLIWEVIEIELIAALNENKINECLYFKDLSKKTNFLQDVDFSHPYIKNYISNRGSDLKIKINWYPYCADFSFYHNQFNGE